MATVNKDFRVKHGLIVEGTTGTINGNDILTVANTTSDLTEGTNLYFTDERAFAAIKQAVGAGTQTNIVVDFDTLNQTISFTAENGVADSTTDDLTEGTTNLYFTNARAVSALDGATLNTLNIGNTSITTDGINNGTGLNITGEGINIDSYGFGTLVNGNLSVTGTLSNTAAGDYALESYVDTAESDAVTSANNYTDSLIGDGTVDGTAGNTVTDRIATAIANLVDSAPATLDTLNELAAALGDDPDFVTTITTTIGEKVAKAGDTMTGFLTLHADPTSNLHAATKQYVDAVSTTVSNLTTDDIAEGSNLYFTDARAVSALEAVVPNFTEVDVNSVATQVAATTTLADTNQTAVYAYASADYRSAKFLVKAAYGTHTEISEVLVTLDTSDNIAITEYAVVGTNGSLGTITAGINGTDVEILYTAGTAATDVSVFGTLIA